MAILKKMGLKDYEIKVYETLIKIGESNAKDISKESLVPQTAVYPTLIDLVSKRLVQKINSDPSIYKANPIEIGIKSFIKRQEEALKENQKEAIKYLKNIKKIKKGPEQNEVLTLSSGKEISTSIYLNSCKRAKETYYILGWKLKKISDKYMFLRELKKLIERGVDVRIILTGDKNKNLKLIRDYKEEGIKIRYLPLENFSIFIMDSKECKITLKNKNLNQRYNIQIADNSLAETLNDYFLIKWKVAQEI